MECVLPGCCFIQIVLLEAFTVLEVYTMVLADNGLALVVQWVQWAELKGITRKSPNAESVSASERDICSVLGPLRYNERRRSL